MAAPIIGADFLSDDGDADPKKGSSDDQFVSKSLEGYEITNHVLLSQMPPRSNLAEKLGLPRLYHNDEYYCNIAMKLDACVDRWHKSIPQPLRLETARGGADRDVHLRALIMRLR